MSLITDDIATLIGKDLSQEIFQEEKIVLQAWLSESEENKAYYNQVKNLFDRTAALKTWQHVDTDEAWLKVKARLQAKPVQARILLFNTYWRVAAALVIAIGIGYFSYLQFFNVSDELSITTGEVKQHEVLPDGTEIVLNKNSSIAYEYNRVEKKRKTKLKGEAFFTIAEKNEEQFVLEVLGLIIEDIGTSFNVRAYPGNQFVEVYVETGEVSFYRVNNPGLRIKAGETGVYDKLTQSFSKPVEQDENVLSYKTGIFVFRDATMRTVIETLNEAYDVKLKLENQQVESCRITVTFKNETIDVVADVIAETLKLSLEKSENEILLKGNECAQK